MQRFLFALAVWLVGIGLAHAQLTLPSAVGAKPADANAKAPSAGRTHKSPASQASAPATAPLRAPSVESIVGHILLLNGADGQLLLRAGDNTLQVDKFTLPGEVISDPKQKCSIDIVSETPIEAKSQGAIDGPERYVADIPACPLAFDALDGAVLVPAQTTACVFQAADCQASPSGLWGPDGATLEKDAKSIAKERARSEASITQSLRRLEARDKGASASALSHEQVDFATQREDLCHDYAAEARHGFCAASVTAARAALLSKRAGEEAKGGGAEEPKHKRKKAHKSEGADDQK